MSENDQTLEGSFPSASKPIFATKYSFFSIFQDLQDSHTFAPLPIQNIRKNSSNFFEFLFEFPQKNHNSKFFDNFHRKLIRFWWFFLRISPNILENVEKSQHFQNFWRILKKILNSDRIQIRKRLTKFCEYFEFGAVRRYVNHVELEKC